MLAKSSYFASDGAAYELFLGRWTKRLSAPVLDFAEFPPEGALLDVGAGTGSMAFAMADRWPSRRILAIDIAEPYVAYAQSRARTAPPIFEAGDAAQLRYDNDTFAGAAAQLVLNFVPQPERALGEMRRVTRTGGRIAAAAWYTSGCSGTRRRESTRRPARPAIGSFPRRSRFRMLCRSYSKRQVWLRSSTGSITIPNGLWGLLMTTGSRSWAGRVR